MADLIEGVDLLTTFDFQTEGLPGFFDPPEVSREQVAVLREVGQRARSNRLNGRGFGWNGTIVSTDNATAIGHTRLLKSLLLRGVRAPLDLRPEDLTGQKVLAYYDGVTFDPRGPQRYTRGIGVAMRFRAVNPPTYVSTSTSTISNITTSDVQIPQGTAPPINAVLAIFEPTNPTITLKDHNGATIGTPMAFSFTPVSGEYLVIDITRREIYRNLTGVPGGTEASSTWTPGTTLIGFDHTQWDALTSSWMTIAISSGTGELTYTKCDF